MNDIKGKEHSLLLYLLEKINDAIDYVSQDGTLKLLYAPHFNFIDDDVEVIKSIAKSEASCEELYNMIEQSKLN